MTPQETELHDRLHAALAGGDDAMVAAIAAQLDAEDEATRVRLRRPDALLKAALWYAGNGIAVFPLLPGSKTPATTHGFLDASCDLALVREWWAGEWQANIGLPTGLRFDVLDVDPPDGWASLAELKAAGLVPPVLGRVMTPRDGTHLYLAATGAGNATGLLPGIDYRGQGGYVVGPPSRAENGAWIWTTPLVAP